MEQTNRTGRRRIAGLAKALSAPWWATRWTGRAVWAIARAAGRFAGEQIPEALLLGGSAAITYGVWQIHEPSGWIVGGLLALLAGWRLGRLTIEAKHG